MNILFVSCSAKPIHQSGVATWIEDMAIELNKLGHTIEVFTMDVSEEKALFDETIISRPAYTVHSVTMANTYERYINFFKPNNYINHSIEPYFSKRLNEFKPDVVHFHALQGMGVNLIDCAKAWGAKTVCSVHECWWFCPYLFMTDMDGIACEQTSIDREICEKCVEKASYLPEAEELGEFNARVFLMLRNERIKQTLSKNADLILPVSNFIGQYFNGSEIDLNKIQVFENGVKVSQKNRTEPVNRTIRLGFVGGANSQKGFNVLMNAMAICEESNIQLTVYGVEADDARFTQALQQEELIAKKEQIISGGIYTETDKETIFENMDVLVFPSVCNESAPLAVREAMRQGVPVIASRCGDPETLIQHGANGALVPRNDAETLAKAIDYVATHPKKIQNWRKELAKNTIPHVSERAEKLVEIYENS